MSSCFFKTTERSTAEMDARYSFDAAAKFVLTTTVFCADETLRYI